MCGRRKFNCPFKLATFLYAEGDLKILYMYKMDCHDCGQTKLGPIMHKFISTYKNRMKADYKYLMRRQAGAELGQAQFQLSL